MSSSTRWLRCSKRTGFFDQFLGSSGNTLNNRLRAAQRLLSESKKIALDNFKDKSGRLKSVDIDVMLWNCSAVYLLSAYHGHADIKRTNVKNKTITIVLGNGCAVVCHLKSGL